MAELKMRPCGGSWAFWDGECSSCSGVTTASSTCEIGCDCLICGEVIPGAYRKVCEKCSAAVMAYREHLDRYKSGNPVLD